MICQYCGGCYTIKPRTFQFKACCPRQREIIEGEIEDVADARREQRMVDGPKFSHYELNDDAETIKR